MAVVINATFDRFAGRTLPTGNTGSLADMGVITFIHYALFAWLITKSGNYDQGRMKTKIAESQAAVASMVTNGPSSLALALNGAYVDTTLTQVTERLILLALLANRPQLIKRILFIFHDIQDEVSLVQLLMPYTNPDMVSYEKTYLSLKVTGNPILQGIQALGQIRFRQNLILRDVVRARYAMIEVIADPHIYAPGSLVEISSLITKIEGEIALSSSNDIYAPLSLALDMLKTNFQKVRGLINVGAAIRQDAIRRLKLLLGVLDKDQSTKLSDFLTPTPKLTI